MALQLDQIALDNGATVDLVVTNIAQLNTMNDAQDDPTTAPRRRHGMTLLGQVENAAVAVSAGRVLGTGTQSDLCAALFDKDSVPENVATLDAGQMAVIPGFVDPHTHTVFGKTRQDEYERRIKGESYLEIAAAGGGIHSSVADLRGRSEEELTGLAVTRLQEMLLHGTTTVEIKSGYGLSLEDELKMLRAAKAAAEIVNIRSVRTCLAAHEMPKEFRENRQHYIQLVCEEILPKVAAEGLAQRCDVFCEPTVFNLEETVIILSRARDLGLRLTVHADELESFGGAVLAARMGADSADHLIKIDEEGRSALAASNTVATLLPGTVFTLGLKNFAPARQMIDQGCAVALATDFNPGSCPISSMPLIMAIACTQMRMTPAETLVACTVNSAWALGLQEEVGSLKPGHWADLVILDGPDYRLIPYRAGHNPVKQVLLGGSPV